jgi:hypothetical protein
LLFCAIYTIAPLVADIDNATRQMDTHLVATSRRVVQNRVPWHQWLTSLNLDTLALGNFDTTPYIEVVDNTRIHKATFTSQCPQSREEKRVTTFISLDNILVVHLGIEILPRACRENMLISLIPSPVNDLGESRICISAF